VRRQATDGGKVRRGARFVWTNLDAALVVVVATVVFVLDLLSEVDQEVVGSATLALLGATAFVLLRDRRERVPLLEFRERVDETLGEFEALKQVASDALCELPYEVLSQSSEWDILSRDESIARTNQRLRFTRGYVSTMENWCSGTGDLQGWWGHWKYPDNDAWIEAEGIHASEIDGGTKKIFALPQEHSREDQIDWCVTRQGTGRFPAKSESISVRPLAPGADHPRRLRMIWPAGILPRSVSLRYGTQKRIPLEPLFTGGPAPRAYIEQEITELSRHGIVELTWTW
jgi:hypothetical protein